MLTVLLPLFLMTSPAWSSQRTLRLDYIFSGKAGETEISLYGMKSLDFWAGRGVNMDAAPVKGNGRITVRDIDGTVLYCNSFCTLFQEWLCTAEAKKLRRSFENVFMIPMPTSVAEVTVELFDARGAVQTSMTHEVDPADIMIRPSGLQAPQFTYLHQSGSMQDCIDVAIVAEGYGALEKDLFLEDAAAAMEALFAHEPFTSFKDRFNIIAVPLESVESGVSVPSRGVWKNTAVGAGFDTFHVERYLTTERLFKLHDALAGVPYEHLIILANTATYGGGGIYNSYTLTAAHDARFKPVVVHEFGHSFGALADEYFNNEDDPSVSNYFDDLEPWEKNITTMNDFSSKWKSMMGTEGVSLYEGGGYQSTGVWRACEDCRMKTNTAESFCPVCRAAIEEMIRFYTEQR